MPNVSNRHARPDIQLLNDIARPRSRFAQENLNCCDKTAARMNLPTLYIRGVAHVLVAASLREIAARARRRNEPPRRRRTRGTI
jgi:hypothetical protein